LQRLAEQAAGAEDLRRELVEERRTVGAHAGLEGGDRGVVEFAVGLVLVVVEVGRHRRRAHGLGDAGAVRPEVADDAPPPARSRPG
jgi:hypothetical protein